MYKSGRIVSFKCISAQLTKLSHLHDDLLLSAKFRKTPSCQIARMT